MRSEASRKENSRILRVVHDRVSLPTLPSLFLVSLSLPLEGSRGHPSIIFFLVGGSGLAENEGLSKEEGERSEDLESDGFLSFRDSGDEDGGDGSEEVEEKLGSLKKIQTEIERDQ